MGVCVCVCVFYWADLNTLARSFKVCPHKRPTPQPPPLFLPPRPPVPPPQEFSAGSAHWLHVDMPAFISGGGPGRPDGGEPWTLRSLWRMLKDRYPGVA